MEIKQQLEDLVIYLREQQVEAQLNADEQQLLSAQEHKYYRGVNDGFDHAKHKVKELIYSIELEERRAARKAPQELAICQECGKPENITIHGHGLRFTDFAVNAPVHMDCLNDRWFEYGKKKLAKKEGVND